MVISSECQPQSEGSAHSYGKILKSTSLIGGAQGINLVLGMVRVKFAAVLIGPVGVGLLGNFQALQGVVAALAGFGIQSSAVRDVAQAISENDPEKVGRTILALQRFCWLSGLLGAVVMAGLSPLLSQWSFGSMAYATHIAWLALVILLGNLTGGQMALIQGMRRISDLARIQVFGAVAGTVITILVYKCLGINGIVPSLLLMACVQYVICSHFVRKIAIPSVKATWRDSFVEAGGMARLGFVFMWDGLLISVVFYLTRAWITQDLGIAAVGIFGAAFGLSGMLINFILHAMGADYYPLLTGLAQEHRAMVRLVNEQTEVGLLLAVPGLLATIFLAPFLVQLFYSSEFRPAVGLLQWFVLGCLGRVISWPLGFVILALNKSRLFLIVETLLNAIHLAFIWLGLQIASLEGAAIAFLGLYAVSTVLLFFLCKQLIGFRWSKEVINLMANLLPIVAVGFFCSRFLPIWVSSALGVIIVSITSLFCLRTLVTRIGVNHPLFSKITKIPGVILLLKLA